MRVIDQIQIIYDPNDEKKSKVPDMPLLVALADGTIYETSSIRGAVALVIGIEYLDVEYPESEWHVRVETARRESMKAYVAGINSVVYDSRKGIIKNNYAAAPGDPDYEDDDNVTDMPVKIFVDNDRLFILSLMKIGSIKVLERSNSYILRSHSKWKDTTQSCSTCLHRTKDKQGYICPVYMSLINDKNYGPSCGAYSVCTGEENVKTTEYIDLVLEYNIDEMISLWTEYYKNGG